MSDSESWREECSEVLAHARRIVIKVGSAVLTGTNGLDLDVVRELVRQLSALHEQGRDIILVSSGAVAAGRGVLAGLPLGGDISCMARRQAASAVGQSRLMHAYDQAFSEAGKISAQILLTRDDLKSRRRFLNARNTFSSLLDWRAIPIVNENDTVMVTELEFGDNDQLAALLLNLAEADLYINLTSANGVYDDNPLTNDQARRMDCIRDIATMDIEGLCGGVDGTKTSSGTGGMYSKLLAAKRAAQLGVPTLILPGREAGAIDRAFAGEREGTWIVPQDRKISSRKYWLAYNAVPSGSIIVDEGAARALVKGGKSLLPAGIVRVEGGFGRGGLVHIKALDADRVLGVGLSNYPSADLKRIAGLHSSKVEAVLGYQYLEAVHRDNMLLDAAL